MKKNISMLPALVNDVVAPLTNDDRDNNTVEGERRDGSSPTSAAHDRLVLSRSGFQNPISPSVEVNRPSRDRMPRTWTTPLFVWEAYVPLAKGAGDLEIFFVNPFWEGRYFTKATCTHWRRENMDVARVSGASVVQQMQSRATTFHGHTLQQQGSGIFKEKYSTTMVLMWRTLAGCLESLCLARRYYQGVVCRSCAWIRCTPPFYPGCRLQR